MDFKAYWEWCLSLVKFSYNNSFQSNIGIAPIEALYVGNVGLQFVEHRLGKGSYWGLNSYNLLATRLNWCNIDFRQLKVIIKATWMYNSNRWSLMSVIKCS